MLLTECRTLKTVSSIHTEETLKQMLMKYIFPGGFRKFGSVIQEICKIITPVCQEFYYSCAEKWYASVPTKFWRQRIYKNAPLHKQAFLSPSCHILMKCGPRSVETSSMSKIRLVG